MGGIRRDIEWWSGWLTAVAEFGAEHGHTDIPVSWKLADGRQLGSWISHRRKEFRDDKLTGDEVRMLAAVGVDVRVQGLEARQRTQAARIETQWSERVAALVEFREEFGHLEVPQTYVTGDGFGMGKWLARCRESWRAGSLPPDREKQLIELGVELDLDLARWLDCLVELSAFRAEHGHGNVPAQYRTADRYMLGDWLSRCREAHRDGTLPDNRAAALRALGVDLDLNRKDMNAERWRAWIADLREYRAEYGHADVPAGHVTSAGRKLGNWLAANRVIYRKGELPPPRAADLRALGVSLDRRAPGIGRAPKRAWEDWLDELESFSTIYGTAEVPADFVTPFGRKLGDWLERCKAAARQGKLSTERRRDLRGLGVKVPARNTLGAHNSQADRARWKIGTTALQAYADAHGHANPAAGYVAPDGYRLGSWLAKRREEYRQGKLGDSYEKALRDLGVDMDPGRAKGQSWQAFEQDRWSDWIGLLNAYRDEYGDAHVANSYRTDDDRLLGMWLSNCRRKFRQGKLPADHAAELTALGVDLETNGRGSLDARWAEWIRLLADYLAEYGCLPAREYRTPDGRPLGYWLVQRRTDNRKGRLRPERAEELRALGVRFDESEDHG